MAATISIYGSFPGALASKEVDWLGDTIKVALLADAYSPNQDTHGVWSDVSTHQVTGTNYSAGGATLTGKSADYNASTNTRTFTANAVEWENSTITARYAVIYDDTTTGKPLVAYVDFGTERSSSDGVFRITWNTDGIFTVTV